MLTIQDRYRRQRIRCELTQLLAAKRAGLPPDRVSRLETGRSNPTLATLEELAAALGASLVLVPHERLPEVDAMLDLEPAKVEAGSAFEDVFIPDPEDDDA